MKRKFQLEFNHLQLTRWQISQITGWRSGTTPCSAPLKVGWACLLWPYSSEGCPIYTNWYDPYNGILVLRAIVSKLSQEPSVQRIVLDFERAIRSAAREVQISGCSFHWNQAMWRKVSVKNPQILFAAFYSSKVSNWPTKVGLVMFILCFSGSRALSGCGIMVMVYGAVHNLFSATSRIHRCPQNRMSDARPQHREVLNALLFTNSVWVL